MLSAINSPFQRAVFKLLRNLIRIPAWGSTKESFAVLVEVVLRFELKCEAKVSQYPPHWWLMYMSTWSMLWKVSIVRGPNFRHNMPGVYAMQYVRCETQCKSWLEMTFGRFRQRKRILGCHTLVLCLFWKNFQNFCLEGCTERILRHCGILGLLVSARKDKLLHLGEYWIRWLFNV